MEDLLVRSRLNIAVTTGIPVAPAAPSKGQTKDTASFQEILERTAQTQDISFSKHAAQRVVAREIALTQAGLEKLNEGLKIARDKGMEDALILVDGSAFIVNAKNGRVITALDGRETDGKAITNISGAVIF